MATTEAEQPAGLRLAGAALERLDDAGAGAPADMKPRYRIAVTHRVVAAPFRPADHRKDAVSHGAQPAALFVRRERHIGLGPAPWPVVLVAIEPGRPDPARQRELVRIPDAEPALLRRIDEEQAAERPERLAAEALLALLVDHDDVLAGVRNLGGCNEAGKTAADHNDIRLVGHWLPPARLRLKP